MKISSSTKWAQRFAASKTLVVGDVMLDRFISGDVNRISPEAPVPIIDVREEHEYPGGAANVARNVASLGGQVSILSRVGDDIDGAQLKRLMEESSIDTQLLIASNTVPTITKTRVTSGHHQLLRFDKELLQPLSQFDEGCIITQLKEVADDFDLIIVEDYAKGLLTPPLVEALREICAGGKIVTVDPNSRNPISWRGFTAVKPNLSEACTVVQRTVQFSDELNCLSNKDLKELAAALMVEWAPSHLLITLGEHGMLYLDDDMRLLSLAALTKDIFDLSGAGDTAIAVFSVGLVSGMSGEAAARFSNTASSRVVEKSGTASIDASEIDDLIEKSTTITPSEI